MFSSLEDRGKIFTRVVSKAPVEVLILTNVGSLSIKGNFHVRAGERILDQLNEVGAFVPITEAEIQYGDGRPTQYSAFIMLNRDQITMMIPTEDLKNSEQTT